MKQVFQADDGTIFEKEIDCEKYESRKAYKTSLETALLAEYDREAVLKFLTTLTEFTEAGYVSKLINFIKSIGEQDGNN